MTRDEQRTMCIEAMKAGARQKIDLGVQGEEWWTPIMTFAFDSLHGLARVCPVEATEEMIAAANREWDGRMSARSSGVWLAMSTAGDLTNAPEKKP